MLEMMFSKAREKSLKYSGKKGILRTQRRENNALAILYSQDLHTFSDKLKQEKISWFLRYRLAYLLHKNGKCSHVCVYLQGMRD